MKIEKISNSQIRCILTGEDLARRQLRLSELAYGTEKARALFRDMMEQAAVQCGFDAENYPLMIEAIPLGSDSIVLIVTKVDNPEELDTRFSNFAPSVQKDAFPAPEPPSPLSQLLSALKENSAAQPGESAEEPLKAKRDFTNESGFTVLPSGGAVRDDTGSWIFSVQSWGARYWTSSRNSNYMSCWEGSGIDDYVLLWICDLYGMFSLRCVK